jgi:hypothetical protein
VAQGREITMLGGVNESRVGKGHDEKVGEETMKRLTSASVQHLFKSVLRKTSSRFSLVTVRIISILSFDESDDAMSVRVSVMSYSYLDVKLQLGELLVSLDFCSFSSSARRSAM